MFAEEKLNESSNIIVGKKEDGSVLTLPITSNILICGPSESGKTCCYGIPLIMQAAKAKVSLVVLDPQGALYDAFEPYLTRQGYDVRQVSCEENMKNNFTKMFDRDDVNEIRRGVRNFAKQLYEEISENVEDIYALGGQALLEATVMRVYLGSEYAIPAKNLESVLTILQNKGGLDYLESLMGDSILAEGMDPCRRPYRSFKQGSGHYQARVAADLAYKLDTYLLNHPEQRQMIIENPADLCAYFVLTTGEGRNMSSGALELQSIYTALSLKASASENHKLEVPAIFIVDNDDLYSTMDTPFSSTKELLNKSKNIYFCTIMKSGRSLFDPFSQGKRGPVIDNPKKENAFLAFAWAYDAAIHLASPDNNMIRQGLRKYLNTVWDSDKERFVTHMTDLPDLPEAKGWHAFVLSHDAGQVECHVLETVRYDEYEEYQKVREALEAVIEQEESGLVGN